MIEVFLVCHTCKQHTNFDAKPQTRNTIAGVCPKCHGLNIIPIKDERTLALIKEWFERSGVYGNMPTLRS